MFWDEDDYDFECSSPFAPWNNPMYQDSPFAPWNNPIKRDDPFACWNSVFGTGRYEDEVKEYTGYSSW